MCGLRIIQLSLSFWCQVLFSPIYSFLLLLLPVTRSSLYPHYSPYQGVRLLLVSPTLSLHLLVGVGVLLFVLPGNPLFIQSIPNSGVMSVLSVIRFSIFGLLFSSSMFTGIFPRNFTSFLLRSWYQFVVFCISV